MKTVYSSMFNAKLILSSAAIAVALSLSSCASNPQALPTQIVVCTGADCPSATPDASKEAEEKKAAEQAAIKQGVQGLAELEAACMEILLEQIDCVIGTGESSLESASRDQSLANARSRYAASLEARIATESEQLTTIEGRDAQVSFKQSANEQAQQTVSRAFAYATRTVHDGTYYKVYTLMVVNPEDVKTIIEATAVKTGNQTVIAQVKSPEVQNNFSKKISAFKDVVMPILKKLALAVLK